MVLVEEHKLNLTLSHQLSFVVSSIVAECALDRVEISGQWLK